MTGRHHHTDRIPAHQLKDAKDHELLARWLEGYREALDELVARHHGWMLHLVRQLSRGERDPEAVVQDAWLDVIRGAGAFRGDGPVRGWLAAIVRRRVCAVAGTTTKGVVGRPQMWTYRARRPTQFLGDAVTGIALCPGRRQSVCVHRAHNLSSLAILTDVALGVHG